MKQFVPFLIFCLLLAFPNFVYAHPGRTASDGCHYCRTNCDRWGVPWNARHCHGGSVYIPQATSYVSIQPTKVPAPMPTIKPTSILNPTIAPTITPTPSPMVEGASTSSGSTVLGSLVGMGIFFFVGYKGLRWLVRKTTPKDDFPSK